LRSSEPTEQAYCNGEEEEIAQMVRGVLVFSSLIHRHHFLKFSKDFRQAGFRLDDDLTRSQQAERKSLSLDFQSLKTKGYQPYFRGSLLQYYSDNKTTHV